jgi:histidine ammonia-lyase
VHVADAVSEVKASAAPASVDALSGSAARESDVSLPALEKRRLL